MPLTYNQTQYSTLTVTGTSPNQEATISYSTLDFRPEIGDTIEVYNDTTQLTETTNYTLDTSLKNVVLKVNTFTPGTTISVYRIAKKDTRSIDFQNASVLTEADLDNSAFQTFHIAQEALDTAESSITADADGSFDAGNKRIKNVIDPTNDQDVATKSYVDGSSSAQNVAALSTEITRLGTSAMATATTGHIPVLANVVEQTVNYTVTVASSKFNIQGGVYGSATETPALTLIRGYTYVFDVSDSSVAGHPLVFMNGSSTLSTSDGVTTTGTAGQAGAKVTVVVSDSVTITKYSCSNHGDGMGNTITLRHDDFKEVADVASNVTTVAGVASSIPTVAGINSEIITVANSSYKTDIETVADSTYKAKVETVADSTYKAKVETVADSTYKAKVETVAGDTTPINSIYTNISQVTTFADTYHTAGTTEPSGSNVTEGDLWFDTANDVLKVYDGSSWGSASSSIATVASQNEFTASDGQGTGNKYFALNHDVGLELVFLNGVRLKRGSDYYCTNSNTSTTPIASGNAATFVRLETVPSTNDILSVMAFGQIANNLAVNIAGGTFTGGVTFEAGTTHNTGNNTFTLPTTRGTDGYVLTRDDSVGTGGTTWNQAVASPVITSITYPTQNGVQATALAATGAQDATAETLLINGSNFTPTVAVYISGNSVSSSVFAGTVSVNPAGTVVTCSNVTKRASADNYTLTVTNATGLTATTTVNFSADPSFTTASGSLGTVYTGVSASKTITAGSSVSWYEGTPTMPTWMTHFADGATGTSQNLTGTPAQVNSSLTSEVQNFNIIIRDSENQSHNRDFSLTVVDAPISTNSGGVGSITTYTGYRVHSWTATGSHSNSFTLYAATVCDVLMVGGGGGAGGSANDYTGGGGGGGGGVYEMTQVTLPSGTYSVTVGTGGTGGTGYVNTGANNGGSSSITFPNSTTYTAVGGGHGGSYGDMPPDTGGSGGGAGNTHPSGSNDQLGGVAVYDLDSSDGLPTGHATYGSNGGNSVAYGNSNANGGGGGGAGSAGSNSSGTSVGGDGGEGRSNSWRTGSAVIYGAGGGGGGNGGGGSGGNGVSGHGAGDGKQGYSGNGASGLANQGGGGGGSCTSTSGNHTGGTGGSGIVVIRYAI